ncbi:MAG: lipocalin family protein [Prevotella sp.]|nr:lipocalin family protein [Prevotella sp.]MBP3212134.1 lipocalin family protein [Prevotella sp.]
MKKLANLSIWMLALMVMSIMTACGSDSDDNGENIDVNQAVGTWMCIQSIDTYRGQSATGLLVGTEVTIKANGTYTSTASSGTSVMGKSGTYTINGNTITANTTGYTFVMQVSFSGNRMTWEGTASNGVNFHYVFQKE